MIVNSGATRSSLAFKFFTHTDCQNSLKSQNFQNRLVKLSIGMCDALAYMENK